jgi:hypothetical protein
MHPTIAIANQLLGNFHQGRFVAVGVGCSASGAFPADSGSSDIGRHLATPHGLPTHRR